MKNSKETQLAQYINTRKSRAAMSHVKEIYCYFYPRKDFSDIKRCSKKIIKLFKGKFHGYKACNTKYHNLQHTFEALIASAVLVDGYNLAAQKLPPDLVKNILIAALFHDTGYIQERWDRDGTGAKHSESHVGRSIAFLVKHSDEFNIPKKDVDVISKIIRCTGINVSLKTIPFSCAEEEAAGWILGSADILGQMSDREYLERLLFLYDEFQEAGIPGYNTEYDIIRNTLDFYETITKRLSVSFRSVYDYARYHFKERLGIDKNLFMEAINRNIAYIEKIMEDSSTNFRYKLKRGDQNEIHKWVEKPAV